jgi:hypothetical protein
MSESNSQSQFKQGMCQIKYSQYILLDARTNADIFSWFLGHEIPIQDQEHPGLQSKMKEPHPQSENIPTEDGGYQTYRAAGKLQDKRAIITGGDSGIGRATAILFAMEGADSLIAYLPEEEEDAQETKSRVEKHGRRCYLLQTDVREKENCRKIVDEALSKMGGIDILFNNAAYQMMVEDIIDLTECALFCLSWARKVD